MPHRSLNGIKITLLILSLSAILVLDGAIFPISLPLAQGFANLGMIICFSITYHFAPDRLRALMIGMVLVTIPVEIIAALLLKVYEYRLDNVPIYVPPGHAIVYTTAYLIAREPWFKTHAAKLLILLIPTIFIISSYWLFKQNDQFGFLCFLLFLILLVVNRNLQTRLFLFSMFLTVFYLEMLGTYLGNWYWHTMLFSWFPILPQGNPPCGIGVIYFIFDACSFSLYKYLNQYSFFRLSTQTKGTD